MENWIPTKDRLPVEDGEDSGDYVLVITRWGDIDIAKKEWRTGWNSHYWYGKGAREFSMEDITHWMPLPKKPKENPKLEE